MATSQTEIESQVIELSTEAFEGFCDDIAGMFGLEMACEQQEVNTVTVNDLKKHFKKLTAVYSVKTEGVMDGTFQLIFDQGGLFTLSGVIVMLPEDRILQEIKIGTIKDSEAMNDAIGEGGNLLVGAWDRIFREGLKGHGHFVQDNSFIGKPWANPEKSIGLDPDGEFVFASYEMTIGEYPAFKCGAVFPKTMFGPKSDAEQPDAAEEKTEEKPATEQEVAAEEKTEEKPAAEEGAAEEKTEEKPATEEADAAEEKTEEKPATEEQAATEEKPATEEADAAEEETEEKPATEEEAAAEEKPATEEEPAATDETEEAKEPAAGPVSEAIQKMVKMPAILPGDSAEIFSAVCAKDIMDKNVVWGSSDDNVQKALEKTQQADAGYMMVGSDGALEGIVSRSDLAGAVSIYLRPVFKKWHRPLDDATLQIKIKWIMSRPVHTVSPDTSLAAIMQNMTQFGQRALPVVDQQGKMQGLITVFDIFQVLLTSANPNVSSIGKTPQAPPLT